MMHTYTPLPIPLTFYTLQNPRNSLDKIFFKLKVTATRSKVKSRSHYNVAHLQPQSNVPTPYQVSTSYTLGFPRYSLDKILMVKITTARSKIKSRSHYIAAHLHDMTLTVLNLHQKSPKGATTKIQVKRHKERYKRDKWYQISS